MAEFWYQQHYAKGAHAHVALAKDDLAKAGVKLESDRVADLVTKDGIIEIKSGKDGLSARDLKQIEDLAKVTDAKAVPLPNRSSKGSNAGTAPDKVKIKTVTIVFTHPEGALKGLRQLKNEIAETAVHAEVFLPNGKRLLVNNTDSMTYALAELGKHSNKGISP